MEFNVGRLSKLVKVLRMEYEVDRLLFAGLTFEQLAEVFDETMNPSSDNCNEPIKTLLYKPQSDTEIHYKIYKRVASYFGIGTNEKLSGGEIARRENVSRENPGIYIRKLKKFAGESRVGTGRLRKQIYDRALLKVAPPTTRDGEVSDYSV